MNSSQFAVKFGKNVDKGFEGGMDVWPFIYTFADSASQSTQYGLNGVGPVVLAGSKVNVVVVLDPDYMFKMTSVKYVAYTSTTRGGAAPFTTQEYDPLDPNTFYFNYTDPFASVHNSLLRNVRVNLSVAPSYRLLYGQENPRQQTTELRSPFPVSALNLSSMLEGDGKVRIPFLLAQNAQLSFEIWNDWTFDVVVGASIFGVKVRA